MYFWNTKQLIQDIKTKQVTQAEFKNYYIGSAVITLLLIMLLNIAPTSTPRYAISEFICNVGLLLTWMNLIFKANGAEQGQDFLNRFLALYFPITLKFLVYGILIAMLLEFFWSSLILDVSEAQKGLLNDIRWLVYNFILMCLMYWRIYMGIQQINQKES